MAQLELAQVKQITRRSEQSKSMKVIQLTLIHDWHLTKLKFK